MCSWTLIPLLAFVSQFCQVISHNHGVLSPVFQPYLSVPADLYSFAALSYHWGGIDIQCWQLRIHLKIIIHLEGKLTSHIMLTLSIFTEGQRACAPYARHFEVTSN